ncbi:MAG: hypothetical protein ACREX3_24895, partial [Gammaproteobacteria bacterium]
MPVDLKSLVTRSIAELKKTLSEKTSELAALKRELERYEAVRQMLSRDGRPAKTTRRKARSGGLTDWKAVLKGLPDTFTSEHFRKTAAGRNKSPVYLRQILSRWTKQRRIK